MPRSAKKIKIFTAKLLRINEVSYAIWRHEFSGFAGIGGNRSDWPVVWFDYLELSMDPPMAHHTALPSTHLDSFGDDDNSNQ